jgi:hypothetical protein
MDDQSTRKLIDSSHQPEKQSISDGDFAAIEASSKLRETSWTLPAKTQDDQLGPFKATYQAPDASPFIQNLAQKQAIPFMSDGVKEIGVKFGGRDDSHDEKEDVRVRNAQSAGFYLDLHF